MDLSVPEAEEVSHFFLARAMVDIFDLQYEIRMHEAASERSFRELATYMNYGGRHDCYIVLD